MKTIALAAIAAMTLAAGSAFAEGNGPNFAAYNAGITNHPIYATVPTRETGGSGMMPQFAGIPVQVQSNTQAWDVGSAASPAFTGLAAQSVGPASQSQLAATVGQGGQG